MTKLYVIPSIQKMLLFCLRTSHYFRFQLSVRSIFVATFKSVILTQIILAKYFTLHFFPAAIVLSKIHLIFLWFQNVNKGLKTELKSFPFTINDRTLHIQL